MTKTLVTIIATLTIIFASLTITDTAHAVDYSNAAQVFINTFDLGYNVAANKCTAEINKITDADVATGVKNRAARVYNSTKNRQAKHIALTIYFASKDRIKQLTK